MQNLKLRDFVAPGVIALGAVVAMAFEYQADNPGLAMGIYATLLGVLLLVICSKGAE